MTPLSEKTWLEKLRGTELPEKAGEGKKGGKL